MARDASIELDVVPYLNDKAMNVAINNLEKRLRSVKRGMHTSLANELSSVMYTMYKSGRAATPVQARQIVESAMGGAFKSEQKAVLRSAQNITSAQIQLEKARINEEARLQQALSRTQTSSLEELQQKIATTTYTKSEKELEELQKTKTNEEARLQHALARTKISPLEGLQQQIATATHTKGETALAEGLTRRDLLKQFNVIQKYQDAKSYPRYWKQLLADTKQFNKTTNNQYKETVKMQESLENIAPKTAKGGALDAFVAKLMPKMGWAAIGAAVYKGVQFLMNRAAAGIQKGETALTEHTIYGMGRNIGLTRALQYGWNISEEAASAPDRYAQDFQMRQAWGQVSDQEYVGLSRMGEYGRMVMSGEAAKDPVAAMKALRSWMQTTDRAEVRSAMGQVGLPLEIMKALQDIRSDEEFEELIRSGQRMTAFQEANSMLRFRPRAAAKELENLADKEASSYTQLIAKVSPTESMWAQRGLTSIGMTPYDINKVISPTAAFFRPSAMPLERTTSGLRGFPDTYAAGTLMNIGSQMFNIVINGAKEPKDVADEIMNRARDEAQQSAMVDYQRSTIKGRIS